MSFSKLVVVTGALFVMAGCIGAQTQPGDDDDNDNSSVPEVSAVASVTSGVAPLEVEFTGVAVGGDQPLTYKWEFGDGGTEPTPTAFHIFETPGNFIATFTVSDADGDFSSATISLVVGANDHPVVQADADVVTGVKPLTVNFTGTVSGGDAPVQIAWTFGDGGTSTDLSPSYTFNFPGSYAVTLVATDADGDSASDQVMINVGNDQKPVAAVGANPTSGPAPLNVAFTSNAAGGDPPLTYSWNFGDGGTSTAANPMHTYQADGVYTASLTVTDQNGDTASSSAAIVVQTQNNQTDPDLRIIGFDYILAGLADNYEPNDTLPMAYYLGTYGNTYVMQDTYIDPFDAVYRVTVANVGPAVADGFLVDLYQDRATAPSAGIFGDQFDSILSIGENGTKDLYLTWEKADPGSYTSWAQVDSDEFITEYDETNNVSAGLDVTVIADEDWFSFYQTSGYNITIDLDNLPGDYDVALYDDTGAFIDGSFNVGTTPENVTLAAPATGYYYVQIYGWDGAASDGQPYYLSIDVE